MAWSVDARYEHDEAALRSLFDPGGEGYVNLGKAAQLVAREARATGPRDTGALTGSILASYEDGRWIVSVNVPHAVAVSKGTRPHTIRPRPGRKVVRFPGAAGGIVYRASTRHPGTAPNEYLQRALAKVLG